MFGYVITNNNTGSESGFWSPLPRLVVKLSDLYQHYYGKIDHRGNYRWSWDWWTVREELAHRREVRECVTCRDGIACPRHDADFTVTYG